MNRLLPFFLLITPAYGFFSKQQNVNVTGRLMCHGTPAAGVIVVLGEHDWPDKNDMLASTKTDTNGTYALAGAEDETFAIQPFIAIGHFCQPKKAAGKQCLRTIFLDLPETVIGRGEPAQQVHLADIHLEHEREVEQIFCGKEATPKNILPK